MSSLDQDDCPDSSTSSFKTTENAGRWLNDCLLNHEECSTETHIDFLPSRLVDVGITGPISPRLLDNIDLKPPQKYITLSHCWGGHVPLTLQRDCLAAMKRGIALEDLPKTFQQAFIVTRQLGFRYIWIDSLCIIQDSYDDWVNESSQMHMVYSNAVCNIAASAAGNATKGLFSCRNPASITPLRILINKTSYYCPEEATQTMYTSFLRSCIFFFGAFLPVCFAVSCLCRSWNITMLLSFLASLLLIVPYRFGLYSTKRPSLVYRMPVLACCYGGKRKVEGLLLEKAGNNAGLYRRIGKFSYNWRPEEVDKENAPPPLPYTEVFRAFDSQAVSLGFEPLPSSDSGQGIQYIVTII